MNVAYIAITLLDAAVLIVWAILDLRLYALSSADKGHLRDGVLLGALGLLTLAGFIVGHYRDAPRVLPVGQADKLMRALAPYRGSDVFMMWQAADPEAAPYGAQLFSALEQAGLKVTGSGGLIFNGVAEGITVQYANGDETQKKMVDALVGAFGAAGITLRPEVVQKAKTPSIYFGPRPK